MKKKLTIYILILTLGLGSSTLLTIPAAADPATEDGGGRTGWFESLLNILGMGGSSEDGEGESCEGEECERGGDLDPN